MYKLWSKGKLNHKDFNNIKIQKQKAIFLDRDGTICEEVNYLSRPEELRLYPYTADAISLLRKHGFRVVLVTNQSGIGRGYFDEKTLLRIHEKLNDDLRSMNSKLDAIYFCPHIPSDECDCRKPKSGMIMRAAEYFDIDLAKSWMIGDKFSDIEAGISAGTKTGLVLSGYGKNELKLAKHKVDITGEDIMVIAKMIVAESGK